MLKKIKAIYADSSMLEQRKAYFTVLISILAGLGYVGSAVGDVLNGYILFAGLKCVLFGLIVAAGILVYRKQFYISSHLLIFSNLIFLNLIFLLDTYSGRSDAFVQAFYMIPSYGLLFLIGYSKFQAIWVAVLADASLVLSIFTRYLPNALPEDIGPIYGNVISASIILSLLGLIGYLTIAEVNKNLADLQRTIRDESERAGKMKDLIESSRKSLSIGEVLSKYAMKMAALIGTMDRHMHDVRANFSRSVDTARQVHSTSRELIDAYSRVTSDMDRQDGSIAGVRESIARMESSIETISNESSGKLMTIDELSRRFDEDRERIEEFRTVMTEIADSSNALLDIINVIEEIAGRTNLLSMNASIEAAHAGDYGKGFAVVAEEIGKLANQSNENSTLIRSSVESIIEAIRAAREDNERVVGMVGRVLSFITATSDDVKRILDRMTELTRENEDIQTSVGSLTATSDTVRTTSRTSSDVMGRNEQGVGRIIGSLAETESSINALFAGSKDIGETVEKISEIGANNLKTIMELQQHIEKIYM